MRSEREPLQTIEHPTGVTYGREGQVRSIDNMLRLPNLEFRMELLATLGASLCLARRRVAASGTAGGRFDVAEFEMDHVGLQETGEDGRLRLSEVFAPERLSDAILRLYERHAEILPDGPERDRAERTAKTVRAVLTPFDLDTLAPALDPDLETVDHRTLGTWSARGARAALQQIDGLLDVALDAVVQDADILALGPDGLLVRRMHSGTERVGGGLYEREFIFVKNRFLANCKLQCHRYLRQINAKQDVPKGSTVTCLPAWARKRCSRFMPYPWVQLCTPCLCATTFLT